MGMKKKISNSIELSNIQVNMVSARSVEQTDQDSTLDEKSSASLPSLKQMERKKKRKALDKERHGNDTKKEGHSLEKKSKVDATASALAGNQPGLQLNLFGDLASADCSVREAAAVDLVMQLIKVQNAFEKQKIKGADDPQVQLEAEKQDGFEECSPSLIYAVRRLIRGVSSSRECARQGFALGLTAILEEFQIVRLNSVMKLIGDLLDVSTKGQEAKECLLGQLFAYGSIARSSRICTDYTRNITLSVANDYMSLLISLAGRKRYLGEPVVSVILDMAEKIPSADLLTDALKTPELQEWLSRASDVGDPDALLLALKLQERFHVVGDHGMLGKLLPNPSSAEIFFSRDHLLHLLPCFKESTFCLPRIHSIWPAVLDLLIRELSPDKDAARLTSSKKSRKGGSNEDLANNIRCFQEVVIEGLLDSSHDRKHLALHVLLLLIPKLPATCIHIVLSNKLIYGLMDILANKDSLLYGAGQNFLKELVNLVGDDSDRCVEVTLSLQRHSNGKFDNITRMQFVKGMVSSFSSVPGCLLFVQHLIKLFVDEDAITDEPSDQSQTTDENSELGSSDGHELPASGNTDSLKNWIIDIMPRVLKNLKLDPKTKSLPPAEIMKCLESKFQVQKVILKFLAVQGLCSASLGNEVTSLDLDETFKWPKVAISSSIHRMCVEQLQFVLEDAQRGESLYAANGAQIKDLGSFFTCFLNTLCNIPSVSLYRSLSADDEKAFKKLLSMEATLFQEELKVTPGTDAANKLHAFRYLLIQVLMQVLIHPGEFAESALDLVICSKKAFSFVAGQGNFSDEEKHDDAEDVPEFMDVLVDNMLSLLPQSSAPLYYAVEQVFKSFCSDITDAGLLQMLRVVKKDLKPPRRQAASSDDDEEDDDFLGIEEAEEVDEGEDLDTADSDGQADHSEDLLATEASDEEDNEKDTISARKDGVEDNKMDEDLPGSDRSDDSDSGMDDDAMFRMEPYIARIFNERKIGGGDSAQSQLIPFKLRVISLLEVYLQKNPGKHQVVTIYSYLIRVFVNAHTAEGSEQLRQRIGAILQKKIFKAKEYPKDDEIQLNDLESSLVKSLKVASHSRFKAVYSLAQAATFWLLKVIHSQNFSENEVGRVGKIFQNLLTEYLTDKKSRLKSGFVKEVVKRQPWVGLQLFGFLLEKSGSAKSEFRRIEALEIIDSIIKSCFTIGKGEKNKEASAKSKLMKQHLPPLVALIQELLNKLPEKQSRRSEVRKFCTRILHLVLKLNLNKYFLKALKPDAKSLFGSQLGEAFFSLKTA